MLFDSVFEITDSVINATPIGLLVSSAFSILLGVIIACFAGQKGKSTKGFAVTVASLPLIVQAVIMAVNGNLGYGVAVMGAFSLVRFRSVAGSAREIGSVFLTVAVGLLNALGYVAYSTVLVFVTLCLCVALEKTSFGQNESTRRYLKITMPEDLDYTGVYDDVFESFATNATLERVKTVNLGSMIELSYCVDLRKGTNEKEFLDSLRTRNGNLTIIMSRYAGRKDEL